MHFSANTAREALAPHIETVHVPGMTFGKGIAEQGMPFEHFISTRMVPEARLPQNFKTFDFRDRLTGLAVSAKTLDTITAARIAHPKQVYKTMKAHINDTLNFTQHRLGGAELKASNITVRELHVGIPIGTTPAQWEQLHRAVDYGHLNNVIVKIYEVIPS